MIKSIGRLGAICLVSLAWSGVAQADSRKARAQDNHYAPARPSYQAAPYNPNNDTAVAARGLATQAERAYEFRYGVERQPNYAPPGF
ncbi:MAG TPA: hypothetical protein VJL90_15770, partial [Pseudorhodoplanes sp.]|nr:hypothetical protein [Pseudorhodoplanes sp.]